MRSPIKLSSEAVKSEERL